MVFKSIRAGAVLGLLLAVAPAVQATMYYFPGSYFQQGDSGFQGYDDADISGVPAGLSGTSIGKVLAGGNALIAGTTTIDAYCVDLLDPIHAGSNISLTPLGVTNPQAASYFSSLYTGADGEETIITLEHLASNALPLVDNATSSAAFQLAVWDVAFGLQADSGFAVAANGNTAATVNQEVATFLALANKGGPITERLTLLMDAGNNGSPIQDQVAFTAAPLPRASWLMFSGLGMLFAVLRRKPAARQRLDLRMSVIGDYNGSRLSGLDPTNSISLPRGSPAHPPPLPAAAGVPC